MKLVILIFFISIITFSFCQEDTRDSIAPESKSSFFNQMTFRNPVTFTPYEIKYGVVYNQGTLTWINKLAENDSIVYESKDLEYKAGNIIELDIIRTNLPNLIFNQNYIDIQLGLGLQYINYSYDIKSIAYSLPDSLGQHENLINQETFYFSPNALGLNIHTTLSWQFIPDLITYYYFSMAYNKLTFYKSIRDNKYLPAYGINTSHGVGTKFLLKNPNKNYRFYLGLEGKINTVSAIPSSESEGLTSITNLDLDGYTVSLTTGIQFGGKRSDGDVAYSYMINNDFISAAQKFESFLAKEKRHIKRKKAIKMLQYCHSQIPYQQMNIGKEYMFDSDYTNAVEWFNAAEIEADDNLKIEIQSYRNNIANEILDSVQINRSQMTIAYAEKLTLISLELMPGNKRANEILANLYLDRGLLNTDIGNFTGAIANYSYALELHPPIENLVLGKLNQLIYFLIEDAYLAAKAEELQMVINSLKTILKIKPELAHEWDSYIIKLEIKLEKQKIKKQSFFTQEYIATKQEETILDHSNILQLGMTYKEVEKIRGTPKIIDEFNEANQYFQMWTYRSESKIVRLFFQENKLIRIEE